MKKYIFYAGGIEQVQKVLSNKCFLYTLQNAIQNHIHSPTGAKQIKKTDQTIMSVFFKSNESVGPGRAVQLLHELGICLLGLEVLVSYRAVKQIWVRRGWALHTMAGVRVYSILDAHPVPEGLEDCAHHGLIENHLWLVILSTLFLKSPRAA